MNEQEFQAQLDQRVEELKGQGEPAEKIQEWIDSQWASFDVPEEEDPIEDVDQPEGEEIIDENDPEAVQEDPGTGPQTETEAILASNWATTNPRFSKDDKKAYDKYKETGEFDKTLLGVDTLAKIEADKLRQEERKPLEDETQEEYLERIKDTDTQEALGDNVFTNNMTTRAFYQLFQTQQLQGSQPSGGMIDDTNDRIEELDKLKSEMDPEEWDKEYNKALSVKSSLEYLQWERWEEAELFQQSQASGKKHLDLTDEDGDTDWSAVWEAAKDGSLLQEFVTQLPNTVIAGVGKGFAQIPGAIFFGAQMANEYRTKTINDALDSKFGQGKWGKEEFYDYTQSEEGQAAVNKAKLYGVVAGQVDRIVDRISSRGIPGLKAVPGLNVAKKFIGEKAVSLLGQKGATVLGGVARLYGETRLEEETEHLQEEIGGQLKNDWTGSRALGRVAAWTFARDTYFNEEEKQEVGNLRAITRLTAGVMSAPGSTIQTAQGIRAINQDRIVNGQRLEQAKVQKMKPAGVQDANNADFQEATRLAEEYKDREIPEVVKQKIVALQDKVVSRNNNHQVILGEHSEESLGEMDKITKEIDGFNSVLEDPNVSEETKAFAESSIADLETQKEEKYYAPLVRDQKKDEYKEESRDEFNKLDDINRKLKDKTLSTEERKNLNGDKKKYLDEIKGKQVNYQLVDENNPQNIQDEIRNIQDRRQNPRQEGELRGPYKNRITRETNDALGKVFSKKGLSGPQKSRATTALLANNAGFINKQVQNFKRKSQGTNFASAFTSDDFKAAMETQMIKNAETYQEGKGAKFGTRALSGVKEKAWNIAKKQQAAIRDKSRKTWGQNTEQLQDTTGGSKSVEETFDVTNDDEQSDDGTGDEYGSYDPSESFERADISENTQALVNLVHDLNEEQVEAFDTDIAKEIESGVEEGALDILKGEGQLITKLNKRVRKPMMNHLNQLWGKSVSDQLSYLENNWENISAIIPQHARNGKFLDGLFVDEGVTFAEVSEYMQADSDKNNKVRLRKLKNALVERMTDVALDRVLRNNPDLRLFKPEYQMTQDHYIEKKNRRNGTVEGLNALLKANWAGTGLKLATTQKEWDHIQSKVPSLRVGGKVAGFQVANLVAINPKISLADTQLHEIGHVFIKAMKKLDPAGFQLGKKLIMKSEYFQEITNNPGYLENYGPVEQNLDRYVEEAIVTALGREGSQLFSNLNEKGKWETWVDSFKEWFRDTFGAKWDPTMTLDDYLAKASVDIITGTGIVEELKKDPTLLGENKIFDRSKKVNKQVVSDKDFVAQTIKNFKNASDMTWDTFQKAYGASARNIARNIDGDAATVFAEVQQENKPPSLDLVLEAAEAKRQGPKIVGKIDLSQFEKSMSPKQRADRKKAINQNDGVTKYEIDLDVANEILAREVELGYDDRSNYEKGVDVIRGLHKAYPDLRNMGPSNVKKKYPKLFAATTKQLMKENELTRVQAENAVWGSDSKKTQQERRDAENATDAALKKKMKQYENVKGLTYALKNPTDAKSRDKVNQMLDGLDGFDVHQRQADVTGVRIAEFIAAHKSELPAGFAKVLFTEKQTVDPNRITFAGNPINMTKKGGWNTKEGKITDLTSTILELGSWPKPLRDVYLDNLELSIGASSIEGTPAETFRAQEVWLGAINRLASKGQIDKVQQKMLQELIMKESNEYKGNTSDLVKNGKIQGVTTSKAQSKKEGQVGVKAIFEQVIGKMEIEENPISASELAAITPDILEDTNKKPWDGVNNRPFGGGWFSKIGQTGKRQRQAELDRIQSSKNKQQVLKAMYVRMGQAVHNGNMTAESMWKMGFTLWMGQQSIGRGAAPRIYKDTKAFDRSRKSSTLDKGTRMHDKVYTVEHMMPTDTTKTIMMAAALSANPNAIDRVFENFIMADLNYADDEILNQIGLQNQTIDTIFDKDFVPEGFIGDTQVPMSALRYFTKRHAVNPFNLHRYDNGKSIAEELGFPPHWEEVFKKMEEQGSGDYGGIAFQMMDNAAERKELGGVEEEILAAYDDYHANPDTQPSAEVFNEAERRDINFQLRDDKEFDGANRQGKVDALKDFLAQDFDYAGGKGDKVRSKIDASSRNKLAAYQSILEESGDTLTTDDIRHIWAEANEIVRTGKSTTIARAKEMEARREVMREKGDEFMTRITGNETEVTTNQVKADVLEKKTFLQKLTRAREGSKLHRLLAPRSNNDFFGLMYDLLPKGKNREAAKQWQEENIINPLNDANYDYGEARFEMQNNQTSALAELEGDTTGKSRKQLRKASLKAKKRLEKPNSAGITVDGQVISDAQVIRVFNHMKNPSLNESMRGTLSDSQIKQVVDYMTLANPDLLAFSKKTLDNYSASSANTHQKMNSRGFKGVNRVRISEQQKQDPLLQQIYGKDGVPDFAPYSPTSYALDQENEFGDMFGPGDNPYDLMTNRLSKKSAGGAYQIAGQDVFSDLQAYVGPSGPLRTAAFLDFAQNMGGFLSKENLNKARVSPQLGETWVKSMQDSMRRIVTGKNRPQDMGTTEAAVYDWVNGSIAAVMFFNTRSAVLQFLSTFNYAVQHPSAFFSGFASPQQWGRASRAMQKSAWFHERGKGASELEMEEIFSQGNKKVLGSERIGKVLKTSQKYGYSLTKAGDKGAIFLGGVPFISGRILYHEKQGLTGVEAETQAVKDFIVAAEEAQQSSRAERLGQQQTGKIGRMILAFANTPQQYNRLMSRSLQDMTAAVRAKDSNAFVHAAAKIMYFGVAQNLMFTVMQGMLFKALGEDADEEDEAKLQSAASSMLDTILRGSGIYGALISTVKNLGLKRLQKGEWDKADVFKGILNTSPAIGSKAGHVSKVVSENIYQLSDSDYSTTNSTMYRAASAINVATNLPADRLLKKYEALADLASDDLDVTNKWLRAAGWDRYTLGESTGETVEDSDNLENFREWIEEAWEDADILPGG